MKLALAVLTIVEVAIASFIHLTDYGDKLLATYFVQSIISDSSNYQNRTIEQMRSRTQKKYH